MKTNLPDDDSNPASPNARADGCVFPFAPPAWIGWAAAACFFFAAIFFAGKSFNVRGQLQSVLEDERVARLEAGTLKNLLEAERILSRGQLDRLVSADRLITELRQQADVARLKITSLASPTGNSPQAHAVAVWNPDRQEGVLVVSQLPPLAPDKDYQLWVIDPQYQIPVDGGVFTVDEKTGEARLNFKPGKTVTVAPTFAVSLERKGGAPQAEGPMVLIGN